MLQSLDLVIAFAVIMSVTSLLITVIVQMASAALALRGKNMANALSLTFQTIDPRLGTEAHALAAYIMRTPILSDSIWAPKTQSYSSSSSLEAIIAQEKALAKAQQALRAANKNDAEVQQELGNIQKALKGAPGDAELKKREAKALQLKADVKAALTLAKADVTKASSALAASKPAPTNPAPANPDSLTDDKPWKFWSHGREVLTLANAIRPGEVYRALHDFSELTPTELEVRGIPQTIADTARNLLERLGISDGPAREAQEKIEAVAKIAQMFGTGQQQQAVISSLQGFGATVDSAASHAYDRFQRWFGSAQDRAEQWFLVHVRFITIGVSILAALLLQLDTVEILRQLRTNPAVVEALIKSVPSLLEQGETILDGSDTAAYHTYLLWLKAHPEHPLANIPDKGTHEAFREALKQKLGEGPNTTALLAEYDRLRPEGTNSFLQARREGFAKLRKPLDEASFELIPTVFMGRWAAEEPPDRARSVVYLRHLPGMAMTAALLSLGAPFWFNLLKNLMNLRPAVATLVERRPRSSPALPQVPPTPTPS
jgi:hypothetical protein